MIVWWASRLSIYGLALGLKNLRSLVLQSGTFFYGPTYEENRTVLPFNSEQTNDLNYQCYIEILESIYVCKLLGDTK